MAFHVGVQLDAEGELFPIQLRDSNEVAHATHPPGRELQDLESLSDGRLARSVAADEEQGRVLVHEELEILEAAKVMNVETTEHGALYKPDSGTSWLGQETVSLPTPNRAGRGCVADELTLALGDVVRVVAVPQRMPDVERFFGDSLEAPVHPYQDVDRGVVKGGGMADDTVRVRGPGCR